RFWLLGLVFVILAYSVFSSGCGRKAEEKPHKMPEVRSPDISTAIEIPQVPYPVIPNELVALLKKEKTLKSFSESLKDKDIKIIGHIPNFRIVQIEVPSTRREEIKKQLEDNPNVEAVVYQSLFKSNVKLNDRVFNNDDPWDDWNLKAINAEAAWDITRGDPNVLIAIVDTGTLLTHEELKDKIAFPGSVWTNDGSHVGTADDLFHGTHVAITAAGRGDNGVGTSGVAPNCNVMPVQVGFALSDMYGGLSFAAQNGAKVINLSMVLRFLESYIEDYLDPSSRAQTLSYFLKERKQDQKAADAVFAACEELGAVVVIAAGNDNIPGDLEAWVYNPFTLAVGAVGMADDGAIAPADFSSYGYMVRVSAPGSRIYSGLAEKPDSYGFLQGTSMAAPHVSGLAGLVLSVNPKLTPAEVRQVIISSAITKETEVNKEMDSWRRAFLLLVGKEENLLLDNIAQWHMLSLIPYEFNKVWEGGTDKAVGACIDARAAVELAKSGEFRKKFAVFTDEDYKKVLQLNPDSLVAVRDMLRYAVRYAGSENVGGPFSLKLDKSASKLEVSRESEPGKGYAEWFEYVKPGLYRHFCKFNGADYSRGSVEMGLSDGLLTIKNRRSGEEIRYAFAEGADVKGAASAKVFYAVAGGNEPNKIGKLLVNYIKPQGKPEEEDFYAYPAGAEPEPVNILYGAKTGSALEMLTGFYDIKIPSSPAIWIKNVTIEEAKTTEIEAGGYGKVLIAGNDATGKPIKANFFMYAPEDKNKSLATGTTNEPLDIVEGNYYVRAALKPDITYEDVRIRRNETTKIDLPQWGQLNIVAKDFAGKPLSIAYWIYKKEPWKDNVITSGNTNKPVGVPSGEHNVYVNSNPDITYEAVKIEPGKVLEISLPQWGELSVSVKDASGKGVYSKVYLYQNKGDDKEVVSFVNDVRSKLIPPGSYVIRLSLSSPYKDVWVDKKVVVKAGEVSEVSVTVKEKK
ncbi:MAG: S8 family serine peptidase, partial [Candidatus Omnitrophota bacterium]|nr:S8 family serine peptidase [Candidatus Omnitrophota bacterium]